MWCASQLSICSKHLQRQFAVAWPNQSWLTDITYIRTHEGWLHLAVLVDLFLRQVVGWSMGRRIEPAWRRRALDGLVASSVVGTGHGAFESLRARSPSLGRLDGLPSPDWKVDHINWRGIATSSGVKRGASLSAIGRSNMVATYFLTGGSSFTAASTFSTCLVGFRLW